MGPWLRSLKHPEPLKTFVCCLTFVIVVVFWKWLVSSKETMVLGGRMEHKNSSNHHLCYVTLKRSLKKVTLMRIWGLPLLARVENELTCKSRCWIGCYRSRFLVMSETWKECKLTEWHEKISACPRQEQKYRDFCRFNAFSQSHLTWKPHCFLSRIFVINNHCTVLISSV